MMKRICIALLVLFAFEAGVVADLTPYADNFGFGDDAFSIDFIPISSLTNPPEGPAYVDYDFSVAVYEISNTQWDKFTSAWGKPAGTPDTAYDSDAQQGGENTPANFVSWLEAAQFVNWLNTSTGHDPAYKFTGTPGLNSYTFSPWDPADDGYNPDNPLRNSNAVYVLPSRDEWVKAAYFNGAEVQTYSTVGDYTPTEGVETNYGYLRVQGLWDVDSGAFEVNGTKNMMGNVVEWTETPLDESGNRYIHGGAFGNNETTLRSYNYTSAMPEYDDWMGIRVVALPEPATLIVFAIGALLLSRRRYG